MAVVELGLDRHQLGWSDTVDYAFTPEKGLNEGVVREISWWKGEPQWMTEFRLKALRRFEAKPMAPWFAVNMPDIDFDSIYYYLKPAQASRSTTKRGRDRPRRGAARWPGPRRGLREDPHPAL